MKNISPVWLILVQWALAVEWFLSGVAKFRSPGFMDNLSKTLEGFAAKTPYTGYSNFLHDIAVPNAALFGNLVRTGELLASIALILGGAILLIRGSLSTTISGFVVLALIGLLIMNLNFYLAAAWSSPSTAGINLLMILIEAILVVFYITHFVKLTKSTR